MITQLMTNASDSVYVLFRRTLTERLTESI